MFTEADIRAEFLRLDKKFGIDTSNCEISVINSYRRMGCCHFKVVRNYGNVIRKVTFSKQLLEQSEQFFYNAVRHEYAHILVAARWPREKHGHDDLWKAACYEVGCSQDRCYSMSDELMSNIQDAAKYKVTCKECGATFFYLRAGAVVKALQRDPHSVTCNTCMNKNFALEQLR